MHKITASLHQVHQDVTRTATIGILSRHGYQPSPNSPDPGRLRDAVQTSKGSVGPSILR